MNGTAGVTIYFNNAFTTGSNVTLKLSAPQNTSWNNGVLFFEDPHDSSASTFTLRGSSNSNLRGIFYMPNATVDLSNADNMTLSTVFVANAVTHSGSGTITIQDYLGVNPSAPRTLRTIALLE